MAHRTHFLIQQANNCIANANFESSFIEENHMECNARGQVQKAARARTKNGKF